MEKTDFGANQEQVTEMSSSVSAPTKSVVITVEIGIFITIYREVAVADDAVSVIIHVQVTRTDVQVFW